MTKRDNPISGPWKLRRDVHGHADAIERDGVTLLHLVTGTQRNKTNALAFVESLNKGDGYGE